MSSQYYDPVKAHEYYEKTKQLKGRTSTKGFNQKQKELAAYAKNQIKTEKKSVMSNIAARAKAERKAFTEACSAKVKLLRQRLKGMSKEQKAQMKSQINAMIDQVKGFYKEQKAGTTEFAKSQRAQATQYFNDEYQKAIQDIRTRG